MVLYSKIVSKTSLKYGAFVVQINLVNMCRFWIGCTLSTKFNQELTSDSLQDGHFFLLLFLVDFLSRLVGWFCPSLWIRPLHFETGMLAEFYILYLPHIHLQGYFLSHAPNDCQWLWQVLIQSVLVCLPNRYLNK